MSTVHIKLPYITFSFGLSIVLAYHRQKGGLRERYEIIREKVFERELRSEDFTIELSIDVTDYRFFI